MTPFGLAQLRAAAAIVHAVPDLSARVGHASTALLSVGHPLEGCRRWLPPCAFRAVVAEAVDRRERGRDVALIGLPPDAEPWVELQGGPPTLTPHPLGLVVAAIGDRAVWVFASTAPAEVVASAVGAAMEAAHPAGAGREGADGPQVGVVRDELVDVTLVVVEHDGRSNGRPGVVAGELLAAVAAAELDRDLAVLCGGVPGGPVDQPS